MNPPKKEQLPAVVVENNQLVNARIDIDKDDLLAIGMDEASKFIQEQETLAARQITRLNEQIATKATHINKLLARFGDEHVAEMIESITATFNAVGLRDISFSTTCNWPHQDGDSKKYKLVGIRFSAASHCTTKAVTKPNQQLSYQYDVMARLPAEIIAELEKRDVLEAQMHIAEQDRLEWRRRASRLPSLERTYRARIAEQNLSQHADGKKLVAAMRQSIKQDVLALPGT